MFNFKQEILFEAEFENVILYLILILILYIYVF